MKETMAIGDYLGTFILPDYSYIDSLVGSLYAIGMELHLLNQWI
jgi:hypothetical protein